MKKFLFVLSISCCSLLNAIGQNNAPVANFDIFFGLEDFNIVTDVLANDTDPDGDNLTASILFGPFNGTIAPIFSGGFAYRGNLNFNGIDFFAYQVCDDDSLDPLCSYSIAIIYVTPINDPPVAHTDSIFINEDESVIDYDVTANDVDVDDDTLTTTLIQYPTMGTLIGFSDEGLLSYKPRPNIYGRETMKYEVCDPDGRCDEGIIYVFIKSVNDAPVAVTDSLTILPDEVNNTFQIPVLENDYDVDRDSFRLTELIASENSLIFPNRDGTVSYVANEGFYGYDTVYYIICDTALCDTGAIIVFVPVMSLENLLPTAISPNGDGFNDVLKVPASLFLGQLNLQVFNRYGDLVYEDKDYQGNWNGTFQNMEQNLPDGTYFYKLTEERLGTYVKYLEIRR